VVEWVEERGRVATLCEHLRQRRAGTGTIVESLSADGAPGGNGLSGRLEKLAVARVGGIVEVRVVAGAFGLGIGKLTGVSRDEAAGWAITETAPPLMFKRGQVRAATQGACCGAVLRQTHSLRSCTATTASDTMIMTKAAADSTGIETKPKTATWRTEQGAPSEHETTLAAGCN
jgi:hypothetical protein